MMIHTKKLKALAVTAAACAALFASTGANAYVYSVSHLELKDLAITFGTDPANVAINSFQYTLTNTATLGGSSVIKSATCSSTALCSGISPVLNALVANAVGSSPVRAENDFSIIGTGYSSNYSNADSVITTDSLVQSTASSFVTTSTNQIAESLLNGNGSASANAEIQSNSTIMLTFTVGGPTTSLSIAFNADPDQKVEVNDLPGSFSTQSNMSAGFVLTRLSDKKKVQWTPNGSLADFGTDNSCSAALGSGLTCAVTADDLNLNSRLSIGANGTDTNAFEPAAVFGAFGMNITGLTAGQYSIALSTLTSTSIDRTVIPEPGSLALIGLALAGLGFVSSQRKRASK